MGKWTTKLNRQIVSSPQLRSLQWILCPLHWGTWAKLGGGHTSWAAPSAHHDGLALPVPSVLRNSHLPHAYVLKGFLTCKDFLALRKVLLAQSHTIYKVNDLWSSAAQKWVWCEMKQLSEPSGQLTQWITLHFNDQVHICTETWLSVFIASV